MAEPTQSDNRGVADPRAGSSGAGQPDPITTKLLSQNSLQLGLVATSINNLNDQVVSLNNSLRVISSNLATSQALERRKEESEQIQERKLAQEQLRQGQESIIEKKIENAAITPAQKLAQKAQFTLGNLGGFFLSLIGGWLTTQAVDAINAQAEGNTEKLNSIKTNVLKGLGVIVGVFIASNGALKILSGSFGKLGIRLAALAAAGLFTEPGRNFLKIIKSAAIDFYNNTIRNLPGGNLLPPIGNDPPDPNNPPPPPPPDPSRPPGQQPPDPNQPNQPPPPLDPSRPPGAQGYNKGGLVDGKEGIDQILAWLTKDEYVMPANIVEQRGVDFFDNLRSGKSIFSTENKEISSAAAQPKVQPMEDISGKKIESGKEPGHMGEINLTAEPTTEVPGKEPASTSGDVPPTEQINPGEKSLLEMGFVREDSKSFVNVENYIQKLGTLPSNIIPVEKTNKIAEKVSQPPPEQPINIIPITIPAAQSAQSSPPKVVTGSTGSAGNVPSFSTSDSSNIYRLNTITMFNVLPV